MQNILIGIILSYLIGSIPTSYIFGKLIKNIDLRKHGSGNLGATNVFRVLGPRWGVVTLIFDILKGVVCVTIIPYFFVSNMVSVEELKIICGIFSIFGHIWTVFLGFKGGKGVATSTGVFFGICWQATLVCAILFGIIFYFSRYVSLGSIVAAIALPVFIQIFSGNREYLIVSIIIAALVIIKHKTNVKRLIAGTENKIVW